MGGTGIFGKMEARVEIWSEKVETSRQLPLEFYPAPAFHHSQLHRVPTHVDSRMILLMVMGK